MPFTKTTRQFVCLTRELIYKCETYTNSPKELAGSSVVFGVFDGMHEGHRYEIEQAIKDGSAYAITFDIDPDEIFTAGFKKLMSNEERIHTLENSGLSGVVVLPFGELKDVEAIDFLDVFFGVNTPAFMHVGSNFHFGFKKSGDANLLKKWGEAHGMQVVVHDLLESNGKPISSTLLREKISL